MEDIDNLFNELSCEIIIYDRLFEFTRKYKNTKFFIFSSAKLITNENLEEYVKNLGHKILQPEKGLDFIYRDFTNDGFSKIRFYNEASQSLKEIKSSDEKKTKHSNKNYDSIFKFGLNYYDFKTTLIELQKNQTPQSEDRRCGLFLLSNISIDESIICVVLKAMKTFCNVRSGDEKYLNFLIIDSQKYYESLNKIESFKIQKKSGDKKNFKFPSIIGIVEMRKDYIQQSKKYVGWDGFYILSCLDSKSEIFNELREELEMYKIKTEESSHSSERPRNKITYKWDFRGQKTIQEYTIKNFISGHSIRLFYQSEIKSSNFSNVKRKPGMLGLNKDPSFIERHIIFSISIDDKEIQKLEIKGDVMEDDLECIFEKSDPEFKFHNKSFSNLGKNLLLFYENGINCFDIVKHGRYDFINSNITYLNNIPIIFRFSNQNILSSEIYKSILGKILGFKEEIGENYNLYSFENRRESSENHKSIVEKKSGFIKEIGKKYNLYSFENRRESGENYQNSHKYESFNFIYRKLFDEISMSKKIDRAACSLEKEFNYEKNITFLLENQLEPEKNIFIHINYIDTPRKKFSFFFKEKIRGIISQDENKEYSLTFKKISEPYDYSLVNFILNFIDEYMKSEKLTPVDFTLNGNFIKELTNKLFSYLEDIDEVSQVKDSNELETKKNNILNFIKENFTEKFRKIVQWIEESQKDSVGVEVYVFSSRFQYFEEVIKLENALKELIK